MVLIWPFALFFLTVATANFASGEVTCTLVLMALAHFWRKRRSYGIKKTFEDLPDDAILQIIDRLSFQDRLAIRGVNHRLNLLEKAALPIASASRSKNFSCLDFFVNLDENTAKIVHENRELNCQLDRGIEMIRRAMKTSIIGFLYLCIPVKMEESKVEKLIQLLPHAKVEALDVTASGEFIYGEPHRIWPAPAISAHRLMQLLFEQINCNEHLGTLCLCNPDAWLSDDELDLMDQKVRESGKGIHLCIDYS